MSTRNVEGTILYPVTPWANQTLTFSLMAPIASVDGLYMPHDISTSTDGNGAFTIALPVPDDSDDAAPYIVVLPTLITLPFGLSKGTGAVQIGSLLAQALPSVSPNGLQVLIDQHAALIASTTVSGHTKIDGVTITSTNGIISVAGGGAPTGAAGGVLGGTYPNPAFAVDMATQVELDSEATTRAAADATNATAITTEATARANADTALSTSISNEASSRTSGDSTNSGNLTTHINTTTNVHGIPDTSKLVRPATLVVAATSYTGVADYYCDGTADQTEINTALATGKPVQLTAGTFTTSGSITPVANGVLVGAGRDLTVITLANAANVHMVAVTSVNNLEIRNLRLNGNSANQSSNGRGVNLTTCTNVLIENVHVDDTFGHNFNFSTCTRVVLRRCRATQPGITANPLQAFQGSQCDAIGCEIVGGNSAIYYDGHTNGSVVDCFVQVNSGGHGVLNIKNASSGNRVIGNYCTGSNAGHGNIEIYGPQNVVEGNICVGTGTGSGKGIEVAWTGAESASNNVISGNICKNHGEEGIVVRQESGSGGTILRNLIVGNTCYDDQGTPTQTHGVRTKDNADYTTIVSNVCYGNVTANIATVGANDTVGPAIAAGAGITLTYSDTTGKQSISIPALQNYTDSSTRLETFSRTFVQSNSTLTAGQIMLTYFTPDATITVSNLATATKAQAAVGASLAKMALFSVAANGDLTCIARSASDTALWTVINTLYTKAIVDNGAASPGAISSVTLTRGQRYAFACLGVGFSTVPALLSAALSVAITALTPRLSGTIATQTDIAASYVIANVGNTSADVWAAMT